MTSKKVYVSVPGHSTTNDREELECEVVVSMYDQGCLGKYSGPPEDCYPDEPPEIELEPVVEYINTVTGVQGTMDLDDLVVLLAEEFETTQEKALQSLEEEMMNMCEQDAEDAYVEARLNAMEY